MNMTDFTTIDYCARPLPNSEKAWRKAVEKETARSVEEIAWKTMEQIDVKQVYTPDDIKGLEHLDYVAGIAPYLRGPISHHVCSATVDRSAVRRFFHC